MFGFNLGDLLSPAFVVLAASAVLAVIGMAAISALSVLNSITATSPADDEQRKIIFAVLLFALAIVFFYDKMLGK